MYNHEKKQRLITFRIMRKIKKFLAFLSPALLDYYEWIFADASENQIRVIKNNDNKFSSYSQLKKHQKKLKKFVAMLLLALLFLLIGLVVGPTLFPTQIESELYIPNGKGDILLGNISRNQATIIFKTLDSANANKPLATKAYAEVFDDESYTNLVRRTPEDDYAVTHIIPIDSLQEGNIYYIRIIAKDGAIPGNTKTISSWGDGKDPIKFYTTGELIPACALAKENRIDSADADNEKKNIPVYVQSSGDVQNLENMDVENLNAEESLRISNVLNENYLQPKNKVQTIISWNTDVPATTVIIYGEGNSKEKKEIVISEEMQTKHAVVLTTLRAGATYYFNVKSLDKNGNVALSEQHSLRTPKPESTITEKIVESFMSIFRQVNPN